MKLTILIGTITILLLSLNSCSNPNPNINEKGKDELEKLVLGHQIDKALILYDDIIYVPIYSDIYINKESQASLLAATLSIRNTSYSDSLFVSKIEYFNTHGDLVRNYIDSPISLPPMATVNYVIEKEDKIGGSGANFMVSLSAMNKDVRPIIQAVMVGGNGSNQGFAFTTEGHSVLRKEANH